MLEVKEKRIPNGYDCWRIIEYDTVYVVVDENGKELFQSSKDPTEAIKYFEKMEKSIPDVLTFPHLI